MEHISVRLYVSFLESVSKLTITLSYQLKFSNIYKRDYDNRSDVTINNTQSFISLLEFERVTFPIRITLTMT
jgi:hypothetical protein